MIKIFLIYKKLIILNFDFEKYLDQQQRFIIQDLFIAIYFLK